MSESLFKRKISLKDIEISPPVALAPMVGLSHSALRSLVQGFGGIGLLFTEMLSAKRLPHDSSSHSPLLHRTPGEYPLVYQLISGEPNTIGPAVEKLDQLGAQGVDLNLGCPAPMQKRQGAGSTLAGNRSNLLKILQEIKKNTALPLSVKIRLGHEIDDLRLVQFVRFLEDQGVDVITIHARLIGEKFCRKPRWHAIAAAKNCVSIPIIANGGIFSVEDAKRCLEVSGADGIMVGRGAVIRPWLCCEITESLFGVAGNCSNVDKEKVFYDFIALLEQRFRYEKRIGRLKQFTHYYSKSFVFGHRLASVVQNCKNLDEAKERASEFFMKSS